MFAQALHVFKHPYAEHIHLPTLLILADLNLVSSDVSK
jgi:hypothetical protein